ncbi:MAG TPA: hypothetical protein ENG11_00555 [candidate division Zixibacteria bacterium]|nr:hypothetical protein [candidate division Zixibacteria bacterium]
MRKKYLITAAVFLAIAVAFGVGISVSPGTFLIQDVPVGKKFDISEKVGYVIRIGRNSGAGVYVLTPRRPSEDGTKATGFYDFPDPSWFHLQRDTLSLAADSTSYTKMWLELPDDPSLYNRHFLLGVDVSPTLESTKGMIAVGAYLLYRFETEPKEGVVPELPAGEMAFVPSVVEFDSLGRRANVSRTLKLFRGGEVKTRVKLYRLDPESEVAKYTILLTPGYRRAPEGIVLFPDQITIDPKEGGKLFVQVAYDKPPKHKHLEEIIIAESQFGEKAFLRVHINLK